MARYPFIQNVPERMAKPQLARAFGNFVDDLLIDLALDQQTRAGGAALAGAGEDSRLGADRGKIKVGIVEDNIGRLAAKLQDAGMTRLAAASAIRIPVAGEPTKTTFFTTSSAMAAWAVVWP